MNYRNLRHLIGGASRLALAIEGDEGGDAPAGGAPAAETGDAGETGDGDPGDAGEAGAGDPPAAAPAAAAEGDGDPAPEPAPKSTRVPWQTKRIDALTATAKAEKERADRIAAENAETSRKLAAYQALYGTDAVPPAAGDPATPPAAAPANGRTYTEAEVNDLVAGRAKLQTIDSTLNRWYEDGVKTGGDAFKTRIAQAGQAFGADLANRVDFFEAVTSLPNGAEVYNQLAGDLDHFADVLAMSPLQLGLELGRLSTAAAAKPSKGPQVSKVPAPIEPVDGAGGSEFDPESAGMEDYVKNHEARRRARAESRGY